MSVTRKAENILGFGQAHVDHHLGAWLFRDVRNSRCALQMVCSWPNGTPMWQQLLEIALSAAQGAAKAATGVRSAARGGLPERFFGVIMLPSFVNQRSTL